MIRSDILAGGTAPPAARRPLLVTPDPDPDGWQAVLPVWVVLELDRRITPIAPGWPGWREEYRHAEGDPQGWVVWLASGYVIVTKRRKIQ